jgi:chromosome segregation protein
MELDLRAASEGTARERLAGQREEVRRLEEALQGCQAAVRAMEAESGVLERELATLEQQEAELAARLDRLEAEARAARVRAEEARQTVATREREQHEAAAEHERTGHELVARREQEAALRVGYRETDEQLAQVAARREALAELERERAGLAPAARQLMQARERFDPGSILGPLSDFVRPHSSATRLAERLLGDWLHAVLVRDQAAVEQIRRWHAEVAPGPLVLLPVAPAPADGSRPLPAGLELEGPAAAWAAALVGGDAPLDEEGRAIRRRNGAVVISGEGPGGLLARRAELADLERELGQLQHRSAELAAALEAAARACVEAEARAASAASRLERARLALREAQATADDVERSAQRLAWERREVSELLASARQRLEEGSRRRQELAAARADAAREQEALAQQLQAQRALLAELESQQEAARERRVHWQVEEAQVAAREAAARERAERAAQALAEAEAAIARLDAELAEIERESADAVRRQAQWTDELAERRVQVQELEAAVRQAEGDTHRAEEALRLAEAAVEQSRTRAGELREALHRVQLAEAELAARRRAMVERVEGEWHRPIAELLATTPEVAGDPEALRLEADRLAQALEALGPVNALAVEEHAEELKRLEFLTGQRDDLVHARDTLLQAVREIDETARSLFLDTFGAIQQHFRTVFQTLFEGGECELRLADESDPLTSDIEIRAAPRGKRTQRIHLLSSGERTMVAISLLFAIYLTKPSPFCLLDEVDAPLDDANVARFVNLLSEFKSQTQFIVITHNPRTMQACDAVYGVTMQEPGVSTIVGVRLGESEPV